MYINHDDLVAMAAGPPAPAPASQGDQMLKAMDREIVSLKRQVSLFPPLLLAHDDERLVDYVCNWLAQTPLLQWAKTSFSHNCTPVTVEMFLVFNAEVL